MAKIDLEKFIHSLIEKSKGAIYSLINDALNDQGLEYKDRQIVKITKPFEVKEGQWYTCIKNFEMSDGSCAYIQGHLYQGDGRGCLQNEQGGWFGYWENSGDKYFRPATEDEIPHILTDEERTKEMINFLDDRNKPKFKKGDFIVDMEDHEVFHVSKVLDNTYEIVAMDDNSDYHMPHYTVEDNYRKWDVTKDAKNGDVLVVDKTDISHKAVFIFNRIEDEQVIHHFFHCYVTDSEEMMGERTADSIIGFVTKIDNHFNPATKEQRQFLFEKMAKAGYEWDIENKTLNRKQNDEEIRKELHIYLDWLDGRNNCKPRGKYTIKDMIDWLLHLNLEIDK